MQSRRRFARVLVCGVAVLAVLVVPVLADELIGTVKSVDVDAKKLVVLEKETDKEITVTVTDTTEYESAKGKTSKVDLEKMKGNVEKAKGKYAVTITHEGGVASKIKATPKKKTEAR